MASGGFELDPTTVRVTDSSLGTGSYGSVKKVEVGGRICAGKIVHGILLDPGNHGVENIRRKYMEECRLMAGVRHPNIVQFRGVCSIPAESPLPVLVMELMEGNLDSFLENTPKIPLIVKRHILEEIAKGLVYLHKREPPIIHRDLTAMNVLISKTFGLPKFDAGSSEVLLVAALNVKISDLGNSRIIDLHPENRGTLTCTPGNQFYMPPEALEDKPRYGPKLDVFSFGHCALFVATQVFPNRLKHPTYYNDSRQLLARSEVQRREDYFTQMERLLPGGLQHPLAVLTRDCLSNMPENRPTAQELVSRLRGMTTAGMTFQRYQQQLATKESQVQQRKQSRDATAQSRQEQQQQDEHNISNKGSPILLAKLLWSIEQKEWWESCDSLDVLVVGQCGVGKSTLLNTMFAEEVATVSSDRNPTTMAVQRYTQQVDGVLLRYFATPGFHPGVQDSEEIVRDIRDTFKSVNMVWYCLRMDDQFRDKDCTAIREITRAFRKDIWQHAVIVLTFANTVLPSIKRQGTPIEHFNRIYSAMKHTIQTFIRKETGHTVPVVAAGNPLEYQLPYMHSHRSTYNPDCELLVCEDWRVKLLSKTFDVMYKNRPGYSLQPQPQGWFTKMFRK